MNTKEALAYAKKALGIRYPFAADVNALLPLTAVQADRAQVIIRPHVLGGIEMFALDTTTRRTLAPGWIVAALNTHERKHYTAELYRTAWAALSEAVTTAQPAAARV